MKDKQIRLGLDIGSISVKGVALGHDNEILARFYRRSYGQPIKTTLDVLNSLFEGANGATIKSLGVTGTAGETVASLTGGEFVNEIVAQSKTISEFFPHIRTLVEMGGEDSKMLQFSEEKGETVLEDFSMNNLCAAGTGSFLDQQASRMGFDIAEEFGKMALKSTHAPRIAGRCSVFAKSDMIHLQQVGTPDYEIIAGLCGAVVRSFISNVGRGRSFNAPVAFFGGVASNAGVVKALADELNVTTEDIFIPDVSALTGAMGAALAAGETNETFLFPGFELLANYHKANNGDRNSMAPLTGEKNDASYKTSIVKLNGQPVTDCFIGIDIGSLSTNVVAIDNDFNVIARRYLRTQSRPIEAVTKGLHEIGQEIDGRVNVISVGTTGSGRYMIGDFVGADVVRNEITAQATAAIHFIPDVDTIFEIGGQDSKYISVTNGAVVDFEMNKVCAAGTGSFIEEQAEKIGLDIEKEFSDKAFAADKPGKFGDRCTVFIESDLVSNQQKGMQKEDLAAGLAYSIVSNYLNKVVGDRRIGDKILFQGGVAWNKSVIAAFEAITGKKIIVPPHHDVTGAIGAAIIAKKRHDKLGDNTRKSQFVGFDLRERKYKVTSFECKACENVCDISRVKFEKEAHYYGARCDLFDAKSAKKKNAAATDLPDLFAEREKLLFGKWLSGKVPPKTDKIRIGIPRALYFYEHFPLWSTIFEELGFELVLSSRTNQNVIAEAIESVKAETCFPVKVIHGHVRDLLKKDVDYLFLPSTITVNPKDTDFRMSYACPYIQAIPYIIRSAIDISGVGVLEPAVFFQRGDDFVTKELSGMFKKEFGIAHGKVKKAVKKGRAAQDAFYSKIQKRGKEVMEEFSRRPERVALILSRPYNGCDSGVNLDLPRKLRDMGKVAIPIDFVELSEKDVIDKNQDMYWRSGQRLIAAAEFVKNTDGLDAIFISNFKCGPDSFIEYHIKESLAGKPILSLEVDEHSADAGAITRLEAFFDSLDNVDTVAISEQAKNKRAADIEELACGAPLLRNGVKRKIYIPYMCDHVKTMAAAFRAGGVDAEALPESDDESLDIGRKICSGKECVPFTLTTGDMIKKIKSEGFDPQRSAFFMPTASGPCRFGQYQKVQKYFLRDMGVDIPLFSPDADEGYDGNIFQNSVRVRRDLWRGLLITDILTKLQLSTRPYENNKGETDRTYTELLDEAVAIIDKDSGGLFDFVWKVRDRFATIDITKTERPVIGLVGEIYMRSHAYGNQNVIGRVEALGGEVWLATISEWVWYCTERYFHNSKKDKKYLDVAKAYMQDKIQRKDERKLYEPFAGMLVHMEETPIEELYEHTKPYMEPTFEGEAILSIGKAIEYTNSGMAGLINVMPFSCLPGTVVSALSAKVRKDLNSIPWLNLDYDGVEETNSQTRIEAFMFQAEKFRSQRVEDSIV